MTEAYCEIFITKKDNGYREIHGDTGQFVDELLDAGAQFVDYGIWKIVDTADIQALEKIKSAAKNTLRNTPYDVKLKAHGKGCYISGTTLQFRGELKAMGGVWKPKRTAWYFRDFRVGDAVFTGLLQKIDKRLHNWESEKVDCAIKDRKYKQSLIENADEIKLVVEKAFADGKEWWPLKSGKPECPRCNFNVIWAEYLRYNKSIEDMLRFGSAITCPNCRVDWTK